MTTAYMLELTEDEIVALFALLTCLHRVSPLKATEKAVLRKMAKLMRGK